VEIQLIRIIPFGLNIMMLKGFYQRHFNFQLIEEVPDKWILLRAGVVEIAFHKTNPGYF
jgi:hypothetical protein